MQRERTPLLTDSNVHQDEIRTGHSLLRTSLLLAIGWLAGILMSSHEKIQMNHEVRRVHERKVNGHQMDCFSKNMKKNTLKVVHDQAYANLFGQSRLEVYEASDVTGHPNGDGNFSNNMTLKDDALLRWNDEVTSRSGFEFIAYNESSNWYIVGREEVEMEDGSIRSQTFDVQFSDDQVIVGESCDGDHKHDVSIASASALRGQPLQRRQEGKGKRERAHRSHGAHIRAKQVSVPNGERGGVTAHHRLPGLLVHGGVAGVDDSHHVAGKRRGVHRKTVGDGRQRADRRRQNLRLSAVGRVRGAVLQRRRRVLPGGEAAAAGKRLDEAQAAAHGVPRARRVAARHGDPVAAAASKGRGRTIAARTNAARTNAARAMQFAAARNSDARACQIPRVPNQRA
ncbi:hypothetical protein FGB62_32g230 [Gracilaria domingensis]|nr:hypothetical protein FGB62_32g230 [Gracilaria domingensis]